MKSTKNTALVIPNWNGRDRIGQTLASLQDQTRKPHIIVVDNGSVDDSVQYISQTFPDVELVINNRNEGFAGGVNAGIRAALTQDFRFIALLNNDAVVQKTWLEELLKPMTANSRIGIVTSKILNAAGTKLDSTGENYTVWGLPYPRGRNESVTDAYDTDIDIFAASGGASLYRSDMFRQIGLFDDDFFAYYEDMDMSFRAQLVGWKVLYQPTAIVYHQIGATSSKLKGFTTYQTLKNLPMLLVKNVPGSYLSVVARRYAIAHVLFFLSAVARGHVWAAMKGDLMGSWMLVKSLRKRRQIQNNKTVSDEYIWSVIKHDLPPNAVRLRALRAKYRKLVGKHG